jgi:hypothetical protein
VGFELLNNSAKKGILNKIYDVPLEELNDMNEEDIYDLLYDRNKEDDRDFRLFRGDDDGVGDKEVFGKMLSKTDEYDNPYLPTIELNIDDLKEEMKEIKDKIGEKSPIKLFAGSMMC